MRITFVYGQALLALITFRHCHKVVGFSQWSATKEKVSDSDSFSGGDQALHYIMFLKGTLLQLVGLTLLGSLSYCNGARNPNPNKFIDLTYAFNNQTMSWPGRTSKFYVESEGMTPGGFWVASRGFCTSEHSATHIDAPYHFNREGRKLHELPLENFIDVPGVMIDIYDKVHKYKDGSLSVVENYALTQEDILEWEAKHGKIPQGSVVLVRTGWASRWGDQRLYRGEKEESSSEPAKEGELPLEVNLNFPSFDVSAARYLAVERQVLGVGVDVLSIDPGNSKTFLSHRLFASRNIYMLEMVANLHLLPPMDFNLWIVPFKIDFGTGAPTRVLGRLNSAGSKDKSYRDL